MNSQVEVSIGMPVFNDIKFIKTAIESLLNQSFRNFELIISDDCSTDGSALICRDFAKIDTRVRYIRQTINLGISKNMEFLLSQASGKYFMWAANDDKWGDSFIENLLDSLKSNETAIMAFCNYAHIDEQDNLLSLKNINYESKFSLISILKLIIKFDDACGYGLFITDKIKGVKFPVWVWPNSRRAYNNIFPTLCFYLAKGKYVHVQSAHGELMYFNRLKSGNNVNHKTPYTNSFLKYLFAFLIWKFNLVVVSIKSIYHGSNSLIKPIILTPVLFLLWFLFPLIKAFYFKFISLVKGEINFY